MSEARPEIGQQFGPYLLRRVLGSGGMGTVYEAQDTVMDRVVALKLISGPYAQDPAYRQRLQREARIAGRLQDPHVVPVHSTGEIDGQLYVDMRLINATDLETMLRQSGPLPPAKAVAIVRQIASALDAAHAVGVLHRDVKPANILVTADDFAYLADFGIANAATEAKLTQMGDVLGTWTYMAPERFRGDETQVTASADTYALACVLVEALTGTPPFSGDTASLVGAHLSEPPPRVSARIGLPPALDEVIARGMAKFPQERYATSGEFARAAEQTLATLGSATTAFTIPAKPTPPPQPAPAQQPPQYQPPQQWTPPPGQYGPAYGGQPVVPAKSKRTQWILIGTAIVLVVAAVAAFGLWKLLGSNEPSKKQAIDLATLDVGRYNTKPQPLPGNTSAEEGRYLESYRIAEAAADPYLVDPLLNHIYGNAVPDPQGAASAISGTGTALTQPVLEKYGMISGYVVQGISKRITDFVREPNGDVLLVMLTSFPNDDAAARAASEMDAVDFAANPDNRGIEIPGYSQARAHYRPGSPSVGATMASGRLVISVAVRSDAHPDVDYLNQRVQHTFDQEAPLVAKFIPLSAAGLTTIQLDPDHMLSRLLLTGERPKVAANFGSIGPHAATFCAGAQAHQDGLFGRAGIDRCAFSIEGVLLRAKDESAAKATLSPLVESERAEYIDHDVAPPDKLPDVKCFEQKPEIVADNANGRFECYVTYGRYIAGVSSNEENDVRQRAAAQYAILVNSA